MTDNKDLKTIQQQFKEQLNTPKTETRIILETEDLYPDLGYEDVSTDRGYGPCYNSSYCNCHLQRRIDISIKTNGWFYTDSRDTMELMENVQNVWLGGTANLSGSREYKSKTLRIRSTNDYYTILNDWNRQETKSLQIVGEFWRNSNPKGVHSTFVNRLSEIGRILDNPNESAERSFGAYY